MDILWQINSSARQAGLFYRQRTVEALGVAQSPLLETRQNDFV